MKKTTSKGLFTQLMKKEEQRMTLKNKGLPNISTAKRDCSLGSWGVGYGVGNMDHGWGWGLGDYGMDLAMGWV